MFHLHRLSLLAMAIVFSSATMTAAQSPSQVAVSVPYCDELKQIANLAMTRERFTWIIGRPRDGNFRETSLPLPGWNDCAFYGTNYYTCDSPPFKTVEDAGRTLAEISHDILACLGKTWGEVQDESSSGYVVLHPMLGPASIALNLDRTDDGQHLVRFSLFLRRP
jgi:hypothetical protein